MNCDPHDPNLDSEQHNDRLTPYLQHIWFSGISYELAEWIASNMSHVVGVATDASSLESEHTREYTTRTVSNLLGKSGVYMIENIYIKKRIPGKM